MNRFDLIIRGGTVVTPGAVLRADLGITAGAIAAIEPALSGSAKEGIDATGCHIFPGVIDAHVHFNDPGRAHWEGIDTGSSALAAGGGTLFFDMPLNAHPPTLDAESFGLKLAAAQKNSLIDFAFWGGLVPGNLERLEELADCGVIGFKAFMTDSGIEDFECVDDDTLRQGMQKAARLQLPVAVHAESRAITNRLTKERIAAGKTSIRDYLDSRPIEAELDAIRRALDLAAETRCALHIVHVSCGAGIVLIAQARGRGVDVSCETCPHYLTLTDEDVERIGAVAKCAPPLRPAAEAERLWRHLLAGEITTVGSDHSPAPPDMKRDPNFFKVWGGISGGQHTLPLLVTGALADRSRLEPYGGRPPQPPTEATSSIAHTILPLLASLLSDRVATRFRLPPSKGRIALGCDADLALVDLDQTFEVRADDLLYRHRQSPYIGRTLCGRVRRTLLRGQTVFLDGKIVSKPLGQLVKPHR